MYKLLKNKIYLLKKKMQDNNENAEKKWIYT